MSGTAMVDGSTTTVAHLDETCAAVAALRGHLPVLERWGAEVWERCTTGGRLLVMGNGGSAAQAQHLVAELVGRYQTDRRPLAAQALGVEPATTTAIVNDFGPEALFARQLEANARPGDIALLLSTSGRSPNLLAALDAARRAGVQSWALTGAGPNPLADEADESVAVASSATPVIQEVHQVAIHLLCDALEERGAW